MKRNLLVAAAITAILSGCGGGDEGGSTNETAGTVINSNNSGSSDDATSQGNPIDAVRNQLALQESKYASLKLDKAVAPTLTPQIAPKLATPVLGETPNLRPQGEPVNGVRNQVELQKSKYASLLADTDRTNSDSLVNQQFRQQYQDAARERNNAQAVENQLALQESKYASLELDKAVAPTLTPQIAPKLAIPVLSETPNQRPQGEPVNGVRNQVELQKSKYASLLADTDRTNSDSLVNQQFRQQYQDAARERNNAQAVENQLALQESKYASLELDKAVAPTLTPQIAPKLAIPVLGETPNLRPQGEPEAPLISGESRKVRKLPSAKPSVVDVNVPVATVTTIADPSEAVQLTIVPPEDQMTLTDNDFVVSQNDPDVNQVKSFKKAKWEAQKEDSFIRNGYAQKGWVTSVGTLPSEMATLAPTLNTTNDVAPAQNIEFGEAPEVINQGKPSDPQEQQDIDYSVVDQASQSYDVPDTLDNDRTPTVMPSVATAPVITEEIIIEQSALLTHVCTTKLVSVADLKNPDTEVQVAAFAFSQAQKQLSDNLAAKGYTQQQYTVRTENGMYAGMYFVHVNESVGTSYELTFTPPKFSNIDLNDRQVILDESNNIVFLDDNDDVLATFKIDTSADCDKQ